MKQATTLVLFWRTSEAILSKGFFAPGDKQDRDHPHGSESQ